MAQIFTMPATKSKPGNALFATWTPWMAVFFFSIFANILLLTGPVFMLQVYDRVLSSRSEETLLALIGLVALLYAIMAVLDHARSEVLGTLAAQFHSTFDSQIFDLGLLQSLTNGGQTDSSRLRDIDTLRRFFGAPVFRAILDLPWTPVFAAAIFVFHPLLGWLALAGAALLFLLAWISHWAGVSHHARSEQSSARAELVASEAMSRAGVVEALGMRGAMRSLWQEMRRDGLHAHMIARGRTGILAAASKSLRMLLQSALLALGAWLVLQGELTPGAMIASSIMMGRALAPVDLVISGWGAIKSARLAWRRLSEILSIDHAAPTRTSLPSPAARLDVDGITVVAPGSETPCLTQVSFSVAPGQALGVIGPSAAGKSSLARALVGILPPWRGDIRLGGAELSQYAAEVRASHIGYLPQDTVLFDATVAENIARLGSVSSDEVLIAAKAAGAHDLILGLPHGYETRVGPGGSYLSGGQRQRIGLARALYGAPALVVLDEPESGLDGPGTEALNTTIRDIRNNGRAAVVMAHRPSAVAECDLILVLQSGRVVAFGPRDQVLKAGLTPAQGANSHENTKLMETGT